MKKRMIQTGLALLCVVLLLGVLDSVILTRITADRMNSLFQKHARIRGHDNITREMFPDISEQLVKYLFSGQDHDLPELNGELLFSEAENLHLKDCAGILRAMSRFRGLFFGLTALIAGIGLYLHVRKKQEILIKAIPAFTDAFSAAALFLFAAASALVIWGVLDFEGLFICFHKIVFTNDLWVLNPEKDLLIQLMPESLFMEYARDILISLLPVLLLMALLPVLNLHQKKKD